MLAAVCLVCLEGTVSACMDYQCWGVNMCNSGVCAAPNDCSASAIKFINNVIQIRGWRCRVTMEDIRQALPDSVTKEGTEYTLHNRIVVRDGSVLEIHGASRASSPAAVVSLLKLKVSSTRPTVQYTLNTKYVQSTGCEWHRGLTCVLLRNTHEKLLINNQWALRVRPRRHAYGSECTAILLLCPYRTGGIAALLYSVLTGPGDG